MAGSLKPEEAWKRFLTNASRPPGADSGEPVSILLYSNSSASVS